MDELITPQLDASRQHKFTGATTAASGRPVPSGTGSPSIDRAAHQPRLPGPQGVAFHSARPSRMGGHPRRLLEEIRSF
jgi:hypothetical protein